MDVYKGVKRRQSSFDLAQRKIEAMAENPRRKIALLLGAGFSYDLGMPLARELTKVLLAGDRNPGADVMCGCWKCSG